MHRSKQQYYSITSSAWSTSKGGCRDGGHFVSLRLPSTESSRVGCNAPDLSFPDRPRLCHRKCDQHAGCCGKMGSLLVSVS
jgi:hypothetical protein